MKLNNLFNRITLFTTIVALGLLASCQENETVTGEDAADVVSESLADAYFEDVTDMGLAAVDDPSSPAGGRTTSDDRFCAALSFGPNSTGSEGNLVIDFSTGCTDPRGNTRSGKILITWSGGPVGTTGFTTVTTFDNYKINGVKLEGTRTVERLVAEGNNVKHDITLDNGKATWPDGSISTRESSFEREWVKDPENEHVTLDGDASGTNRRGKDYAMNIRETLKYTRACFLTSGVHMAVAGVKVFTVGNRKIIIDYGDGRCDRIVTVTIGDMMRTVNVGS